MNANPALVQLGFSPGDRIVLLHADDLGLCHAANRAFADLVEAGRTVTGSVMVPCPWFLEIAAYGRAHPECDLGVHLTLNSEHRTYRWGPISTCDPVSGLLDADGYSPRTVEALHASMSNPAAVVELRTQIDRALAAGIEITHLDTHMGAVLHPELLPHYVALALEYRVPALFPRLTPELIRQLNLAPAVAVMVREQLAPLEAAGLPLIDHLASPALHGPHHLRAQFRRALDALQPGLTHFILHPAAPGAEIEAIADDPWWRVADYRMLMDPNLEADLRAAGVHVLTYRELRQVMRAALGGDAASQTGGVA